MYHTSSSDFVFTLRFEVSFGDKFAVEPTEDIEEDLEDEPE